jgi:hypothetical protein
MKIQRNNEAKDDGVTRYLMVLLMQYVLNKIIIEF